MPVLARCVMRRDPNRTSGRVSLQNLPPGLCRCSSPRSRRFRRKAWANTRSSFISTMTTSWGFIRGSFCGIGVRARSARRPGPTKWALSTRKCVGPDFSGPDNSLGTYSTLRHPQYRLRQFSVKYFVAKLCLRLLLTEPALKRMSVDPDGESASATVAGCCVPITPPAQRKFTQVLRELSRSNVTIRPSRVSKKELRRRIPVKSNIGFGAFPDFVFS